LVEANSNSVALRTIIVLLCGGDKASQARHIKAALRLADESSESP
jgi:putative component of toxin-antitoxin plasmid stabilization module